MKLNWPFPFNEMEIINITYRNGGRSAEAQEIAGSLLAL